MSRISAGGESSPTHTMKLKMEEFEKIVEKINILIENALYLVDELTEMTEDILILGRKLTNGTEKLGCEVSELQYRLSNAQRP